MPKDLSIVLTGWRKSVQDNAKDAHPIALCHNHGVIEEGEPARRHSRK